MGVTSELANVLEGRFIHSYVIKNTSVKFVPEASLSHIPGFSRRAG